MCKEHPTPRGGLFSCDAPYSSERRLPRKTARPGLGPSSDPGAPSGFGEVPEPLGCSLAWKTGPTASPSSRKGEGRKGGGSPVSLLPWRGAPLSAALKTLGKMLTAQGAARWLARRGYFGRSGY